MKKFGKIVLLIIISIIGLAVVKMWEAESGNNLTWILGAVILVLIGVMFRTNKNKS